MATEKIPIQVTVELDDEFFEDLICTIFEGGSNYWIDNFLTSHPDGNRPKETPKSTWVASALNKGGSVAIYPSEDENKFVLTKEKLIAGIKAWMITSGSALIIPTRTGHTIDNGNIDAIEADNIMQYALFGKLVYG